MISADATFTLLVLVALAVLFYGPWQWVCADAARGFLFAKRDAIFDLAADGKLDFHSKEYRVIRSSLEASIRFAHELTLPRFLVLLYALRKHGVSTESGAGAAIDRIENPETRAKVRRLVRQAYTAMTVSMMLRSAVVVLVSPLILVAIILGWCVSALRTNCVEFGRTIINLIQVEAENAPSAKAKMVPVRIR